MAGSSDEEQAALVALLRALPEGMTWSEVMAETLESGSAVEVWRRRTSNTLFPGVGEADPLEAAHQDVLGWTASGIRVLTVLDTDYPARLRGVHQAPPLLFGRGTPAPQERAVSVVGSRKASAEGLRIAANISQELVASGITVLSGLAEGIDAAAHRAALDAGGRTVAVIGTGITRYYPPQNQALQDEIAASGLVLSQFWPEAPGTRRTFPMRNATMSGYGQATVVVEAGEKSGARIQARVAVEHGRPVVLTGTVLQQNEWARVLLDQPGVHRADSLEEVMSVVRKIDADRAEATRSLSTVLGV